MRKLLLMLCGICLQLGCSSSIPQNQTTSKLNVSTSYFSGANQYYLFYKSQKMIDDVIETAAKMDLNMLRTWGFCDGDMKGGYAFQKQPRQYDEATFRKMDYIIYKASLHNIRLVIPFVNNWDEMGGMMQYVRWANSNNHDDFYAHPWIRQVFKDYISYFLNRTNTITGIQYKDDPAIAIWELANEPRHQSETSSDVFHNWVREMSSFIKSIDDKHLVSIGDEGFFANKPNGDWMHNGSQGVDWIQDNLIETIDIVTFHLYPDHWHLTEDQAKAWIVEHLDIAKNIIKKPVYMGEFGLQNKSQRDRVYTDWYNISINNGMDGILFWLLSGHQDDGSRYPDYDGFTVYYPDSTSMLIKNQSQRFLDRSLD